MVQRLKNLWAALSRFPGGKWIFARLIGYLIPYTGTISPIILDIRPGQADVMISDGRRLRNHLKSIHALALANAGELTTGLALHFAMKDHERAILTKLESIYLKKARGRILVRAQIDLEQRPTQGPIVVEAVLTNQDNVVVARVKASWLIA